MAKEQKQIDIHTDGVMYYTYHHTYDAVSLLFHLFQSDTEYGEHYELLFKQLRKIQKDLDKFEVLASDRPRKGNK